MKTTEIKKIVSYVLGLFDTLVLLVAWPSGKKGCRGNEWTKISLKDMTDPAYRQKLAEGNIGVDHRQRCLRRAGAEQPVPRRGELPSCWRTWQGITKRPKRGLVP